MAIPLDEMKPQVGLGPMLLRALHRLRPIHGRMNGRIGDGICTPEETQRLLEYERTRADRSGQTLSIVIFSHHGTPEPNALEPLVQILKARLRTTDAIGWLDSRRLAVLLPYTSSRGAAKVASDVIAALHQDDPTPEYRVYCYPDVRVELDRSIGESPPAEASPDVRPLEVLLAKPLPAWKRALDVIGAAVGLIVLSPVFLAAALAVRCTSPGPILFTQKRSGLGGRPFTIYKFRTMVADAHLLRNTLLSQNEQDGPAFKIKNDPRITPVGRFLRAASIDELPQLWNVLKGDMSLVGPRPLPCEESEACQGWRRRRLEVTPGLTCIWQVRGRSSVSFDAWVRMDVQYIRSCSLPHDLKLIAETVPAVLLRKGAC